MHLQFMGNSVPVLWQNWSVFRGGLIASYLYVEMTVRVLTLNQSRHVFQRLRSTSCWNVNTIKAIFCISVSLPEWFALVCLLCLPVVLTRDSVVFYLSLLSSQTIFVNNLVKCGDLLFQHMCFILSICTNKLLLLLLVYETTIQDPSEI